MGKKYIIELEDKPFRNGNGDFLYRVKGFNSLVFDMTGVGKLTPYTEPDLEQVRKEAYEEGYAEGSKEDYDEAYLKGYNQGLSDAWECARKIALTAGLSIDAMYSIFGTEDPEPILREYSVNECIEKIQQYEQEKEEIKVGDEVKSGDEKYIVLQKYLNNIDELMVVLFNKRDGQIDTWHMYNANGAIFEKTDSHFPEIAEVLQKMREG